MKIFLTGGTGFIGSYIAKALSDKKHEIVILARNPDKIPAFHSVPGVSFVQGGINDYDTIIEALKGMDAVIHVGLNYREGATGMLQADTLGSVHLFEQATKAGVKEIIYTSSTAVVDFLYMSEEGRQFKGRIDETLRPHPVTFYGATKAASENYLMALSYQYPTRINIIRPGYIFGNPVIQGAPTQPDTRFKEIVEKASRDEDIKLDRNDGTQFLWAGDLAKVYVKLLESDQNRRTCFALSKNFVSWGGIAQTAIDKLNSKSKLILTGIESDDKGNPFIVEELIELMGSAFDNKGKINDHINYWVENV